MDKCDVMHATAASSQPSHCCGGYIWNDSRQATKVAAPLVYTHAYMSYICAAIVCACVCVHFGCKVAVCAGTSFAVGRQRVNLLDTQTIHCSQDKLICKHTQARTPAHTNVRLLKPHTFTRHAAIVVLGNLHSVHGVWATFQLHSLTTTQTHTYKYTCVLTVIYCL